MGATGGAFLSGLFGALEPKLERKHQEEEDKRKELRQFYLKSLADPNVSDAAREEAQNQLQKLLHPEAKKGFAKIAPMLGQVVGLHRNQQRQPMDERMPNGQSAMTAASGRQSVMQGPDLASIYKGYRTDETNASRTREQELKGIESDPNLTADEKKQARLKAYGIAPASSTPKPDTLEQKLKDIDADEGLTKDEKHRARLQAYGINPKEAKTDELQDKLTAIDKDSQLTPAQKSRARLKAYGISEDEKPPTQYQQSRSDAIAAYKEKHGLPPNADLSSSEILKAEAEAKEATESPDAKESRKLTQELARQRIADSRQRAVQDASPVTKKYAEDFAAGKIKITDIPARDRDAVMAYMGRSGLETPDALTPAAGTVLAQIQPVLDQIQAAKESLEPIKGNNTPGYFLKDRVKYSLGLDSGTAGLIADLSMSGILGASRILRGGASRTKAIFEEAQQHTPNTWVDSPKLMYDKLSRMEKSILDGKQALYEDGRRSGVPVETQRSGSGPASAPKGPPPKTADEFFKAHPELSPK